MYIVTKSFIKILRDEKSYSVDKDDYYRRDFISAVLDHREVFEWVYNDTRTAYSKICTLEYYFNDFPGCFTVQNELDY